METNLCEFFIGTNVVFNTRGFVQFFAFSTRKQCKVISQCEEKKLPLWPNAQSVLQQQRDSINSKSWFSRRNAFPLPCLSFSFLPCFDLQKKMSFLCELVLYYVENYGFYFNGLKKRQEEPLSLFWPDHSLCSGLKKKKKIVKSLEQGSMCLKEISFFCVFFFFSQWGT